MRRKPRLTYNEAVNGGLDAAKFYGIKGADIEKAFRPHIEGMSNTDQQKFYKDFYQKGREEKK